MRTPHSKFFLMLVFLAAVVYGCALHSPLKGYYYEAKLPAIASADITTVSEFADALARDAGLLIVSRSPDNVFLSSPDKSSSGFTINISFYTPKNALYIATRGNVEGSNALAATQKAIALFQAKFPAGKLSRMTVYPGALGP